MKEKYMVIDFEANCSNDNAKDHEIIEFPALLIDTESGEIISEFRYFVKMLTHDRVSDFITNLTHITDDKVKSGLEWKECLKEFEIWCYQNNVTADNTTIITCGDWDFLTMFPKQMSKSGVTMSKYLRKITSRWTNIKIYYRTIGGKKGGMPTMLRFFELELIGHHHSGIDDCRNIHRICVEIVKRGIDITVPTRIMSN